MRSQTNKQQSDPYRTIYHRDGTVTIWDVYKQCWARLSAGSVSDGLLATLSDSERRRIARMTEVTHG